MFGVGGALRQGVEVQTDDENDELGQRRGMLKRALGLAQPKKTGRGAGRGTRAASSKKRASAKSALATAKSRSKSKAHADARIDEDIQDNWMDALEADLGAVQPEVATSSTPSASSSSVHMAVPSASSFSVHMAVPEAATVAAQAPANVPFKDANGYVFVMQQRGDAGEMKKVHLGGSA